MWTDRSSILLYNMYSTYSSMTGKIALESRGTDDHLARGLLNETKTTHTFRERATPDPSFRSRPPHTHQAALVSLLFESGVDQDGGTCGRARACFGLIVLLMSLLPSPHSTDRTIFGYDFSVSRHRHALLSEMIRQGRFSPSRVPLCEERLLIVGLRSDIERVILVVLAVGSGIEVELLSMPSEVVRELLVRNFLVLGSVARNRAARHDVHQLFREHR